MSFIENVLESSTKYSMIATDCDGVILLWNEAARRLYGYAPPEILGQPMAPLHTREDMLGGLTEAMTKQALDDGEWEGTVAGRRKDGTMFSARLVVTPRRGKDGKPLGFLLMSSDATDEVRLAAELERSRAYAQWVFESAPDAMVIVNADGEIQLANAATERLFGYAREELIGRQAEMLISDRYRDGHPGCRVGFFSEPRACLLGAAVELTEPAQGWRRVSDRDQPQPV